MKFDKTKIPQKYRGSISDCYQNEDGCWIILKRDGNYFLSEEYGSETVIHEDTIEEAIQALKEYALKDGISTDEFIVGNTACTFAKKETAGGLKFNKKPVKVEKVGSKYVYCDDGYAYQKHQDRNDCLIRKPPKGYTTDGTLLFLSAEDADKEAEAWLLYDKLKYFFRNAARNNFTLEQLQKTAEIYGIFVSR